MTAQADVAAEVVTRSLVRFVEFPEIGGPIFAVITLDNGRDHTRPSTLGPAGLASLAAALDQIASHSPAVSAVCVTGKPHVFAAGADLNAIASIASRNEALNAARAGHQVFAKLRDLTVPTFAFLNGPALGGGLELALHCDYRTLSAAAGGLSFPEVFLGIVPGWGGTQLLPNLIGADGAVEVIIGNALNANAQLRPPRAAELGIVDVLLEPADFLTESLRWASAIVAGTVTLTRDEPDRGVAWDHAVEAGRRRVEAKLHGAAQAPCRALDLLALAKTATFAEGTAAEDEALADLIMTDQLRAGLYAFDLVNRRAKRPAGAPAASAARPVTKVAVIGAGQMATQLALLFVRRLKVPVVLTDVDPSRLAEGVAGVHDRIAELRATRHLSADAAGRLTGLVTSTTALSDLADADFVIEAVFEDVDVKRAVLAELERHLGATAVLATNTSSLSVAAMAADLDHPERVVGLHFFNPVAVLPLVEVAAGAATDESTLATVFAVAKSLGKSAVAVADAPGFVVNRLLTRLLCEIFAAIDEGTDLEVADSALEPLGLPMTPLQLLGLVGPAIALHVAETLSSALGPRFAVSATLRALVHAGKPGVYLPPDGDDHPARPRLDPTVAGLLSVGNSPSTAEQTRDRAVSALADEVSRMLADGVVADMADLDLCMLLGAGWPFHLGGISPYLRRNSYGAAASDATPDDAPKSSTEAYAPPGT